MNVLVTAVGGDLGQAVVKALRLSDKDIVLYGCDMDSAGIGGAFVDSFYAVPRADNSTYTEALNNLCLSLAIDAVIPCSEPEIYALSWGNPPKLSCGIPVVCQKASWLNGYGDKLICMNALFGKIDMAQFADGLDTQAVSNLVSAVGFPVVVKSRQSSGSRSLQIVENWNELHSALTITHFPIVQEYIDMSGGEFSVGVFVCDNFTSAIAFKRDLGPVGCSWFAETSTDKSVLDYTTKIAQLTGLQGSANIQVRKSVNGVRLLEINPRFSSLVAARAVCGFRDAEWSLELALGQCPEAPDYPFGYIRFRRFFHELLDFGEGYATVTNWCPSSITL